MMAMPSKNHSFRKLLGNKLNRYLPFWVRIVYCQLARCFPGVFANQPLILPGRLVGKLRSQILKNKFPLRLGHAATNCGLIRIGEQYIGLFKNGTFNFCWEMGLRADVDTAKGIRQILYVARFNNELRLQRITPLDVETSGLDRFDPERDLLEDARLIHNGKEVVIVANHVPGGDQTGAWPKQANAWPLIGILEVSTGKTKFSPLDLRDARPPQKNWIPFGKDGETFLQFSIAPHRILRVDPHTGHCNDAWLSQTRYDAVPGKHDFKGGAPLIELEGQMLGACHSWSLNKNNEREYLTYLYLTKANPPYEIIQISSPLKILVPDRIQYLVGMVLDRPRNCITMSYGVNDCDNYFVEVPLVEIMKLFRTD